MRLVVSLCLLTGVLAGAAPNVKIIAHRGGVVDAKHPENSLAALNEAVRRGYWMMEMDIQESKDGRIVVHHDDFEQSYGVKRWPREMIWDEISKLRSKEDGSRPLEFHEYAAACKGRTQLMVDIKAPSHSRQFYQEIERILRENGLLEHALFIGTAEARAYFKGKARISVESKAQLQALVDAGENVSRDYFLFEHGDTMDARSIAMAKRLGIPAVVSINIFHYRGQDHRKAAQADIERLKGLGLTYFQIDSEYDSWLR
ncbi:MAG: hypothetical protein JST93_03430 [Acidobacteria bacterium]|nr:hypothetical protein [Acidobacteriota bacterium]